MNNEKKALVLTGGGAKGCYEIGAWKLFKEVGIEFDAVVGASVGALNAAFIAQDYFEEAVKIWENISLGDIISVPPEFFVDGKLNITRKNIKNLKELKKIFKNGKMDSSPLHELIKNHLDEKKIRSTGIDLGIVTYNLTDFTSTKIFLDETPEGEMADYLLASASFPTFSVTKINGKVYVDGGVHDNMPFKMARDRGYTDIVIVDISGLGINRRPQIVGTRTLYIKNSMEFGTIADFFGILKFESKFLKDFTQLGYLDTGKAVGEFIGYRYFFRLSDSWLRKIEEKLVAATTIETIKKKYSSFLSRKQEKALFESNLKIELFLRNLLPSRLRGGRSIALGFLECVAFCLALDVLVVWDEKIFLDEIRKKYQELKAAEKDFFVKRIQRIFDFLFTTKDFYKRTEQIVVGRKRIYSPFEYNESVFFYHSKKPTSVLWRNKWLYKKFPMVPSLIVLDIILEDSDSLV